MSESMPVNPRQHEETSDDTTLLQDVSRWLGGRSKTSLALASAICYAIFLLLARLTNVPADRGFNGSILLQPSPIFAMAIVLVGLIACTLLMSIVQFHGEVEDPLFPMGIGLIALSWRGGSMTNLLQLFSLSLYWALLLELILLYAMFTGCAWLLMRIRQRRGDVMSGLQDPSEWKDRLLAAVVSAVVMGFCMYLFAQTDAKKQVLASVGISAFAGAAASFMFFEIRIPAVYAAGPLIVGIVGYLVGFFLPGPWLTARIGQPLAYPLPLDYAGLGIAGCMLGYWSAVTWKEEGQA